MVRPHGGRAVTTPRIEFGYNPPTGNRLIERVTGATFVRDLEHVLDIAAQHFSSLWVSDHFMTEDRFRMECWTQLTWIAARYPGPMLGTIVMANSYRHPPLLAKMAASLQVFSHGRFILGYGAGWTKEEYVAYGYEFPATRVRIEQMVEGIQLIRALWTEPQVTFHGQYYDLADAWCEPKPQPGPPIMIGGEGEKYLLRAVAEHADWWNALSGSVPVLRHKVGVLKAHCDDVGRDFSSIRKTYTFTAYLARTKSAAVNRAGSAMDREFPPFAGTPGELVDHIQELVDLGFDLFQMVFPDFPETTDMELFADEVMPAFR
jgi:alkanesulfonate monooxygenase SsuD/methylene tetrahydromethanopterin reductase-like flavin-dependent oxidoreductase (luciferase family)